MARRTCPTCARRYAGHIDPDCVVCEGVGVLALHPVAIHHTSEPVTARAIELFLENAAAEAIQTHAPGEDRLHALEVAVAELREARVIGAPLGVAEPSQGPAPTVDPTADTEASRAAYLLGRHTRPSDRANLDAPHHAYGPDDRPRATGMLPTVSANGSRAACAKVADPTDALGPDTRAQVYDRMANDRRARVIASAVPHVPAARKGK